MTKDEALALDLALEVMQIKSTLSAFGPDEGVIFTQDTWAKLHAAMSAVVAQPAPVQEPVALDVTIEGDEAQALYDQLGDDREDPHPIRIVVSDGHSGYGLYVAQADYQDEGAVLITSITPPAAQRQWVGLTPREIYNLWEDSGVPFVDWDSFASIAQAIEAKLTSKNGGAA